MLPVSVCVTLLIMFFVAMLGHVCNGFVYRYVIIAGLVNAIMLQRRHYAPTPLWSTIDSQGRDEEGS